MLNFLAHALLSSPTLHQAALGGAKLFQIVVQGPLLVADKMVAQGYRQNERQHGTYHEGDIPANSGQGMDARKIIEITPSPVL